MDSYDRSLAKISNMTAMCRSELSLSLSLRLSLSVLVCQLMVDEFSGTSVGAVVVADGGGLRRSDNSATLALYL